MSSDDVILNVENISKCFQIYTKPTHRLLQMLFHGRKKFFREFWALHNISFQVKRGECIGIVGKNGAGKSTLLQVLTGTLQPTAGSVQSRGVIAALLELGSGFNPEFTGRENVFLNAAILGLNKQKIEEKFVDIVKFADIGDFLDQPVKTYSSGMMLRLAFSVQIMIEPDILIVDEALAVGDGAFQRKCYARMDQMIKKGMTLLLVSHDTETIKQRCSRVLFLKDGENAFWGDAEKGVVEYLRYLFPKADEMPSETKALPQKNEQTQTAAENETYIFEKTDLNADPYCWGVGGAKIHSIRIYGLESPNLLMTPCKLKIEVEAYWNIDYVKQVIKDNFLSPNVMIGIRLSDVKNYVLYGTNNDLEKCAISPEDGAVKAIFSVDLTAIKNGDFFLTAAISVGNMLGHIHLVWDDLSIQLRSISPYASDGMVHFQTNFTAEKI